MEEQSKPINNSFEEGSLDRVLSKYISIWIWSILFGGTATITFGLTNTVPRGQDWGSLSIAFIALLLYGLAFVFMSWFCLYKYLRSFIIPKFFPTKNSEIIDSLELNHNSRNLQRSFMYLIGGLVSMVTIKLAELIIASLNQRFDF